MPVTVFVGPGTLILGDATTPDVFSCDLTGCVISDVSPTYSEVTGCGTQSAAGSPDYEMTPSVVQDIANVDSLLRYSWTNHNQVKVFHFIPNKNGATLADISPETPALKGDVLVTKLDVGTTSTGLATASKTWKIQGDVGDFLTAAPAA